MILLLSVACVQTLDLLDTHVEPSEVVSNDARYVLAWDTTGVTPGDGYTVGTDRGWSVHVSEATLTSYAASMVQCVDIVARRGTFGLAWLVTPAFAGHSGLTDPSTIEAPIIEDFANPTDTTLGEVAFDEAAYCRVHWLVAGASLGTRGLETYPWMIDHTLALEAEATGPNGEHRTLSLASASPVGGLADVDAAVTGPVDVRIVRELATIFDGVDFTTSNDADIAWAVLSNLGHGTRVVVSARSPM